MLMELNVFAFGFFLLCMSSVYGAVSRVHDELLLGWSMVTMVLIVSDRVSSLLTAPRTTTTVGLYHTAYQRTRLSNV